MDDAAIFRAEIFTRRLVEKGKIQTMRSRTSVSEIGLGEWPGISQNGRRQAPPARCVPTIHAPWLGAQDEENFGCRQPFLIRKWPRLGAIPLFGAQRSSQTWHAAAFPSTYTFRMEANLSAGLSCAQTKSICTKVGRQCQNHGIENGC